MKNAMRWTKANPITVASVVLIIATLTFSFMYTAKARNALRDDATSKAKSRSGDLNRYEKHPVELPADKPGDDAEIRNITLTEADVDILRSQRQGISAEAEKVTRMLRDRNRIGHSLLLDKLFPAPPAGDTSKAHLAKASYKNAIVAMFGRFDPAVDKMDINAHEFAAKLNAGGPADMATIAEEIAQIAADNFEEGLGAPRSRAGKPENDEQQAEVERLQRNHISEAMKKHARRFHIYTSIFETRDLAEIPKDFAFDVGEWAVVSEEPKIEDVFEGQMNLWIQQDLVRAIALVNGVDQQDKTNVLEAPVKHLLQIDVDPSYAGVYYPTDKRSARGRGGSRDGGMGGMMYENFYGEGLGYDGMMGDYDEDEEEEELSPDSLMPPKFEHSASGRYCNPLYDVRKATLTVVVDSARLHQLLQAINEVNLMTVLEVHITDVDEYAALEQGFFYGRGDLVEAELVIESIWLRDWTQPLMPAETRINLEIDKKESDESDEDEDDEDEDDDRRSRRKRD